MGDYDLSRRDFMLAGTTSLLSVSGNVQPQLEPTDNTEYEFQGVADLIGPRDARPDPGDSFFDQKIAYAYRYESYDNQVFYLTEDMSSWTSLSGVVIHDRADVSSDTMTDGGGVYSVDSSVGTRTLTLSSEDARDGIEIRVKRNGGNDVTIETEGSATIDGGSTLTLSADDDSATLVFNATNTDWEVF